MSDPNRALCEAAEALARREASLAGLWGFDPEAIADDGALIGAVLAGAMPRPARDAFLDAARRFAPGTPLFDLIREDVAVTAARDRDPGGPVATLMAANGLHNLLAHRLAAALYAEGLGASAFAIRTLAVRAFGADIMPQAQIGRRVWLDHGLGVVIGQTARIAEDCSLWHGVTLGTDLLARGEGRHPRLGPGCVIGAGALLIGPIRLGAGVVVGAGAVVTEDVPDRALVVGSRATILPGRARPAADFGIPLGPL